MEKALFLDRDGVINKVLLKNGEPFSPRTFEEFEVLPKVKESLNQLKKRGFINIVVTNQPDIPRGLIRIEELNKIHAFIKENLPVDDIMVCPHDNADNCQCRKPKLGMLFEAESKWNIDLRESFLIGDTWKDITAGKSAGCRTILIDMPYNQEVASDYRVRNLKEAIKIINILGGKR